MLAIVGVIPGDEIKEHWTNTMFFNEKIKRFFTERIDLFRE
jgi:hypothetical protein